MQYTWHEGQMPALLITQVYAFLFSNDGRILLLEDSGTFTLPGGKPEPGESLEQALSRECMEEAQVIVSDLSLLGYQEVMGDNVHGDGTPYAQLRYIGKIREFLPSAIDPSTGRSYNRVLLPPANAAASLQWGDVGQLQVDAATRLANARLRLT